jgi:hypothetical protein
MLKELPKGERVCFYLDTNKKKITNWPGTMALPVHYIREGSHNFAGKRFDAWFKLGGFNYHAVQYGTNTQICHIKKIN